MGEDKFSGEARMLEKVGESAAQLPHRQLLHYWLLLGANCIPPSLMPGIMPGRREIESSEFSSSFPRVMRARAVSLPLGISNYRSNLTAKNIVQ